MKTRLSLFCIAITMLLSFNVANAQHFGQQGSGIGGQQSAFQAVSGDLLQSGLPGRLWFEANFADEGLGFNGSYLTLGGKTRLFEDFLDGRWLLEGQFNHSIEDDGDLFVNIGIERVFSVAPANADISFGVFYDYDADDQQTFSDGFHQIGVSGAIKTPRVDLIGNGYIPVGTDTFITGDHLFVGNNIALQAGIESALQGFDVTLRTRPKQLAFVNGYVDFGAYHYDADIVDPFAGGRLRVGFQLVNGIRLAAEINHDERFDTTGALSVAFNFGANSNGRGSEYAGLARDLEQFSRNDHIVRFSQDLVVAINPLTGQAFNVIHANNTQLGVGNGTIESPFATLAEAEAASAVNDIIFVDSGDGTDTGYQDGIALQDGQQLLSGGGTQFILNANGIRESLAKDGATAATISNVGGNEVVLLADNNVIGGINIDAIGAEFGILGSGISGGTFNEITVNGATSDGIALENVAGNFDFIDNAITSNGKDGVFVNGSTDPTAVFNFNNNVIDFNAFEGINLTNFDAASVILDSNQTSNNGANGVIIQNQIDSIGAGTDVLITSHVADGNGTNGVLLEEGNGTVVVSGGTFTNNAGAGLSLVNWQTTGDDTVTLAALPDGTQPDFSDNVVGINLELSGVGLTQTVAITDVMVDNNVRGIVASTDGVDTVLNLNVGGTTTITNNANEAVAHLAEGGSTINSVIESTDDATPLLITGNSAEGAAALSFTADGTDPLNRSEINALVRNVNVNSIVGPALAVNGTGESQVQLTVEDSTLQSTGTAVQISLANNAGGEINQTYFDNVTFLGTIGLVHTSQAGTLSDLSITNSTIDGSPTTGPTTPLGTPVVPPFPFAGVSGVVVSANGAGNFTRVNLASNTIQEFIFDGIDIDTTGDARLFATIQSNQILQNGPGLNDDGDDDGIIGPPGPGPGGLNPNAGLFHDGIDITTFGTSVVSVEVLNNIFLNNFERSLDLTANDTSQIVANGIGNQFSSDIGADSTPMPVPGFMGQIGVTPLGGTIALDLSANTFAGIPITVVNAGPATDASIGLDGLTNGFGPGTIGGVFAPTAFGLTDALIDTERDNFEMNIGFPNVGR